MVYVSEVTQDLMMIPDAVYHELIFAYPCLSLRLFTQQCICSDFKMLENQSTNLQANSGLKETLKQFFCSEEGFKDRTTLSLFTVNGPCQLPTVNFDMSLGSNHHANLRIRPILLLGL